MTDMPEFKESDPKKPTPALTDPMSKVHVITYAAAEPEKTPPALRGMARALINGELGYIVAHGRTPEQAGEKLTRAIAETFAKLAGRKPRGRPRKDPADEYVL